MSPSDILEDVLPTKGSRWSAAMTILLVPLAYNFPSILPVSWQAESEVSAFLIRCILVLLTALIGSLIVLVLVLRDFAQEKKRNALLETEKSNANIASKELKTEDDRLRAQLSAQLQVLQAELQKRNAEINRLRQENKDLNDRLHAQPIDVKTRFDPRKF